MLDIQNSCLIVIDIQGKLAQLMHEKDRLFENIQILVKGCKVLNVPILWTQQVPRALGQTITQITELLTDIEPINKASFSCCGEEKFLDALEKLDHKQVLLCGIETHICIYQTALDLLKRDYYVEIVTDAVSSRTLKNKEIALKKMQSLSTGLTSTEMALFELVRTAEHPQFKQIAKLVK
ncbi:MAG: hydrolase [Planctomycetota bacterium]|jgi:nicotinamidase-related amidase